MQSMYNALEYSSHGNVRDINYSVARIVREFVQPRCTAIEIPTNVLFFLLLLITPLFMPENIRKYYAIYTTSVFER